MNYKFFIFICFSLLFFSCNLFLNPLHNIKNDFKWKNKKLATPTKINFLFNPYVIKELDSDDSDLSQYLTDPNRVNQINSIFRKKLEKRNFIISTLPEKIIVSIDTIVFKESSEMINITCTDKDNDYIDLGDHPEFNYSVKISSNLKLNDSLNSHKQIKSDYSISNFPRESLILNCFVAYNIAWIDFEKVINNSINKMSYDYYLELNNK